MYLLKQVNYVAGGPHGGFQAEVVNSAPGVHAVAKKVVAAPVHHGAAVIGHGYGHAGVIGHAPVAVGHAVAPIAKSYTHGAYNTSVFGGHGIAGAYNTPVFGGHGIALGHAAPIAGVYGNHGIGYGAYGGINFGHGGAY